MGGKIPERERRLLCLRAVARRWAGEDLCELGGERPVFLWLYGTTMIEATLDPDGAVALRAFLVLHPAKRSEIEAQLDSFAGSLPVGTLEVDDEGDVALVHRVHPGVRLARLDEAVREMCQCADRLDDILCDRLGGIRSVDRFHHDVLVALGDQNFASEQVV